MWAHWTWSGAPWMARVSSCSDEGSGFDVANTGYQVSPEQLQLAASQVERGAAKIKAAVDDVMRVIDAIASDWSGGAQQQFSSLCQSWANSANELDKSVIGIATLMKNAAEAYEEAEAQVSRLFDRDAVALVTTPAADAASSPTPAPVPSTGSKPFGGLGPRPRGDHQTAG